jgi:hypothetical protein
MRGRIRVSLSVVCVVMVAGTAGLPLTAIAWPQGTPPTLDEVVAHMARYVAGYGEQASLIVAVEKYDQNASAQSMTLRQRRLTAEFAIVRAEGAVGWVGFRDVIEVDGKKVTDRPDRLRQLFMEPSFNPAAVVAISNESARYNFGPAIRNFNVPTTTLFFFHPANVGRFKFTSKGTRKFGSVEAWEIGFVEIRRPTLIMKRDGTDVPCEGTVWVAPDDGTVLRTRLQLRHFADQTVTRAVAVLAGPEPPDPLPQSPPAPPSPPPATGGSGATTAPPPPPPPPPRPTPRASGTSTEQVLLESLADIDVTYDRDVRLGLWLPSKMTEVYEVPFTLSAGGTPSLGRMVTEAKYSDFKQFQTSAKITFPK